MNTAMKDILMKLDLINLIALKISISHQENKEKWRPPLGDTPHPPPSTTSTNST